MRNKWLLVQLGKDDHYHVMAFTARRVAEHEGERDKKHGVPFLIVDLDEMMFSPKMTYKDLRKAVKSAGLLEESQ